MNHENQNEKKRIPKELIALVILEALILIPVILMILLFR